MSLRWKILIVLLVVGLLPMSAMQFFSKRTTEHMGQDLAAHGKTAMLHTVAFEFERTARDQARAMGRERTLLSYALRIQAAELTRRLINDGDADDNLPLYDGDMNASSFPQSRCILRGPRECTPLPVDFEDQTVVVLSGMDPYGESFSEDGWSNATLADRIPSFLPVYRSLAASQQDAILWQWTVLGSGVLSLYPKIDKPKRALADNFIAWFKEVRDYQSPMWKLTGPDPFTMEPVFTLSAPLRDAHGALLGVTAIAAPVSAFVAGEEDLKVLSPNLAAFLVEPEPASPGTLRVLAGKETDTHGQRRWRSYIGRRALCDEASCDVDIAPLARDLAANLSGVRTMPFRGEPCIWAYTPLDEFGAGLVLIAPEKDLASEAHMMEEYVLNSVRQQVRFTGYVLFGMFALLCIVAFLLSRPLIRRARELAKASQQLAAGDFSVRVPERGDDELTMVARSFNTTVPALADSIRLKQSLGIAREVQHTLLPDTLPRRDNIQTAAIISYSEETGGDFYDIIEPCGPDRPCIGALVADVSGHGMPAALLMASTRAFLRARFLDKGRGEDIADAVSDANRLLFLDEEGSGRFVTLFYLEVDLETSQMYWVRAGHEPALLYDIASDTFEQLKGAPGLALGVDPDTPYTAFSSGCLCSGQIALLYTDGLIETENPDGEFYGRDRLQQSLRRAAALPAGKIARRLLDDAARFRGGATQEDDITIVVLKILALADEDDGES